MELSQIQHIIDHPESLDQFSIQELAQVLADYPYCQTLHLLYQKRLQSEDDSERYHNTLARTACYASDSSKLFYWLTEIDNPKELLSNLHLLEEEPTTEDQSDKSTLNHPLSGDHTFGYWLKLAINRELEQSSGNTNQKSSKQSDLIDEFLQKNPSIQPQKDKIKGVNINMAKDSSQETDNLMTETLAQIYLDQGLYNKAIKAYEILSLKNPQKSSFFAQRIAQIAELKK